VRLAGRPPKRHIPWGEIRHAWDRGDDTRDIATRFGIPASTIYAHVFYHEWPNRNRGRNRSRVDLDVFERLWHEGVRTVDISAQLGICLSHVGKLVRQLNLPRRESHRPRPTQRRVIAERAEMQLVRCEAYLARERERINQLRHRCDCGQVTTAGPTCPRCAPKLESRGAA